MERVLCPEVLREPSRVRYKYLLTYSLPINIYLSSVVNQMIAKVASTRKFPKHLIN